MNLLARLTVDESYSSIALSEYTHLLTSSVETIGAILVASGVCTLINTTITANISIRTNQSESHNPYGEYVNNAGYWLHNVFNTDIDIVITQFELDSMVVNLTIVARQILMLPIVTEVIDYASEVIDYASEVIDYASTTSAAKFNSTGLVTGLIAAIVVTVVLLLLIILTSAMAIFCKFHQSRRY